MGNANIQYTDFRTIQPISMGENSYGQAQPIWEFRNEGKEILQKLNSAPGVAIGADKLSGVDFQGTLYVSTKNTDNDWIFFYQNFINLILSNAFCQHFWTSHSQN